MYAGIAQPPQEPIHTETQLFVIAPFVGMFGVGIIPIELTGMEPARREWYAPIEDEV